MARMTEEEADALDELWTHTTPAIDTSRRGYFTRHMAHLVEVDDLWTLPRSIDTIKQPTLS